MCQVDLQLVILVTQTQEFLSYLTRELHLAISLIWFLIKLQSGASFWLESFVLSSSLHVSLSVARVALACAIDQKTSCVCLKCNLKAPSAMQIKQKCRVQLATSYAQEESEKEKEKEQGARSKRVRARAVWQQLLLSLSFAFTC